MLYMESAYTLNKPLLIDSVNINLRRAIHKNVFKIVNISFCR